MHEDREALRKMLRARQRDFVLQEGKARLNVHAVVIARIALAAAGEARSISGYLTNGREVDALPALELACVRGIDTALPHIAAQGASMRFLRWAPGDPLVPGPYGALQPADTAPEIEPDAILTPLVGFDRRGNRIGQGGGFYDRVFEALPAARRVGLAWSVQEIEAVPVASWDQPLHAVITERERIDCT